MKCSRVSEESHISLRIVAQLRHCPFSQPSLPLFFPLRPPLPHSIPIHPPRFPPLHLSSPQLPLLAAMRSPWLPLSPPALLLSIRPTSTPLLRPSRPAALPPTFLLARPTVPPPSYLTIQKHCQGQARSRRAETHSVGARARHS